MRIVVALGFLLSCLVGCDGGGTSGSDTPSQTGIPTAEAPSQQTVGEPLGDHNIRPQLDIPSRWIDMSAQKIYCDFLNSSGQVLDIELRLSGQTIYRNSMSSTSWVPGTVGYCLLHLKRGKYTVELVDHTRELTAACTIDTDVTKEVEIFLTAKGSDLTCRAKRVLSD